MLPRKIVVEVEHFPHASMFTIRWPPGLPASEEKLQRELNLARNVRLAADHSEIGCSEEHAGHAELHAIRGIEELAAELEVVSPIPSKAVVLE